MVTEDDFTSGPGLHREERIIRPGEEIQLIVLDLAEANPTPDYEIVGRVECAYCGHWLWLGHRARIAVVEAGLVGSCASCRREHAPDVKSVGRIVEHRLCDGPFYDGSAPAG